MNKPPHGLVHPAWIEADGSIISSIPKLTIHPNRDLAGCAFNTGNLAWTPEQWGDTILLYRSRTIQSDCGNFRTGTKLSISGYYYTNPISYRGSKPHSSWWVSDPYDTWVLS